MVKENLRSLKNIIGYHGVAEIVKKNMEGDEVISKDLSFEIMCSVNQLKSFIREGYDIGEIGCLEKNSILDKLGQIKQVVLSDCCFKQSYQREYPGRIKMIR